MRLNLKCISENFSKIDTIEVEDIDTILDFASSILNINKDKIGIRLCDDGTLVNDNEYLRHLKDGTDVFACTADYFNSISYLFLLKMYQLSIS